MIELHFRYDDSLPLADQIRLHAGLDALGQSVGDYVYVISIDRDKIQLRPGHFKRLDKTGADSGAVSFIEMLQWTGAVQTVESMKAVSDKLAAYSQLPILVEMYHKTDVRRALADGVVTDHDKVVIDHTKKKEHIETTVRGGSTITDYLKDLQSVFGKDSITVIRRRRTVRWAGGYHPGDKVTIIDGQPISTTPDGRIRLPDGHIGAKLHGENPIKKRANGSIWYRCKPHGSKRAVWRKWKDQKKPKTRRYPRNPRNP